MDNVSLTLWSVISIPMFFLFSLDTIAWISSTAIVSRLKSKNIGILITDHNVDETLSITDRAYLMVDGKLFKSGTAQELASDPQVRKVYLGQNFELRRAKISTEEGYL